MEENKEIEGVEEVEETEETVEAEDRPAGRFDLRGLFGGRPWILFILVGFVVLLLVIVLIVRLAGGGGGGGASSLVTPGTITAALVNGGDRFARRGDTGELVGIEPALVTALAEAEGLEAKLVEVSTVAEALNLLDTSAADVVFGRISAEQSPAGYVASEEYARCGLFLVTALHDYTDSLALMTGYSVGILDTVKGTASSIDGYEFTSPRDYEDALAMGKDVRDRAINMGICGERDAIALVRAFPNALQTQEIAGGPKERYVAVFPRRSAAHAALLNGIIERGAGEE